MSNLRSYLRDPIWQMIGAVIGLVALLIGAPSLFSDKKNELSIVRIRQVQMASHWLPTDSTKLLMQGRKYDIEKAVIDRFLLINQSSRAIRPEDFVASLTINANSATTRIVNVESCSKPYAEACSADGVSTPEGGSYTSTVWRIVEGKWQSVPPLINQNDQACVNVLTELKDIPTKDGKALVAVTARIKDYDVKTYSTWLDYAKSRVRWYDHLHTTVKLDGVEIFGFLIVFCLLFYINTSLAAKSNFLQGFSLLELRRVTFTALICMSTSEIIIFLSLDGNGKSIGSQAALVVWPLLAIHLAYFLYLLIFP